MACWLLVRLAGSFPEYAGNSLLLSLTNSLKSAFFMLNQRV